MVAAGAVLILCALLLLMHNRREDAYAGQETESLLAEVEEAIPVQRSKTPVTEVPKKQEDTAAESTVVQLEPELPVVMLDGYGYVGYLELLTLELKLPVMAEWDYERLKISPCRQSGSSRTDDLVIAAHNYDSHFGRLKKLSKGDTVIFTDMEGIVNTYFVEKLETLGPDAVDTVLNSSYDLVLYTCTEGGRTRVAVFCRRAEEITPAASSKETGLHSFPVSATISAVKKRRKETVATERIQRESGR